MVQGAKREKGGGEDTRHKRASAALTVGEEYFGVVLYMWEKEGGEQEIKQNQGGQIGSSPSNNRVRRVRGGARKGHSSKGLKR